MPFIADELRLDSGACRTSTLFQRSSGLFVYLLYHSITLLCYIVLFLVSSFCLVRGQYSSLYFGCRVYIYIYIYIYTYDGMSTDNSDDSL